ncbi:hypothetical protein AAAU94_24310, partial [Bacteroides cellulosilyticus]|uniref:hypothetical protein n=1 Tax=Bacteroides cellulosilyticus TaxID=246787 RepID=UPI0032C119DD
TDYFNEEAKIKGKTRRTNTHKAECLPMPYSNLCFPIAGCSAHNWKTDSPQMETNEPTIGG